MDKEDVASGINKQSCKCCLVLQLLACDLKKIPAEIQTHMQPALNSTEKLFNGVGSPPLEVRQSVFSFAEIIS